MAQLDLLAHQDLVDQLDQLEALVHKGLRGLLDRLDLLEELDLWAVKVHQGLVGQQEQPDPKVSI